MRILIIDELCYPQLGGIQVRFKALAEEWAILGHEVHVTAIDHIGTSLEQEVINNVVYNRVIKDSNYYKSGPFGRRISTIIKYTIKLRPYLKQNWDMVIFCQFPILPQLFYKYFYKKRAKTVLDFVEHRSSKLWKIINHNIINAADKVVCVSEHVRRCAYAYRKDNMYVMPSFVDTSNCITESRSNYIFLGRLEEHKHPEFAIEAVVEYNKTYNKKIQLDVVGNGNMYDELKSKYSGIPDVKFAGRVDEQQKQKLLANGRMLILPSEREGLPIVVIEAMAYGIPTITTDYPGNGTKFFVDENQIGLVASPSVTDIVNKIREMEENYDKFVNKCIGIKGNYDIKLISKNYINLFN